MSASLPVVDSMLRPLSPAAPEPVGTARTATEETLGPVGPVVNIANEDGIRRASDSQHVLGATVWTNDHAYSHGVFQAPWGGPTRPGLAVLGRRVPGR